MTANNWFFREAQEAATLFIQRNKTLNRLGQAGTGHDFRSVRQQIWQAHERNRTLAGLVLILFAFALSDPQKSAVPNFKKKRYGSARDLAQSCGFRGRIDCTAQRQRGRYSALGYRNRFSNSEREITRDALARCSTALGLDVRNILR
jgi:hypothetical protein